MVLITRRLLPVAALVFVALLAACGGSDAATAATETRTAAPANDDAEASGDDDHDDEDHDDEDHDDEDHDDEDHDDDHDDEDHDDEDHDDDHDGAAGGLDAHVHGSGELFVAWTGTDVLVDLVSPADNIFGFEREPSTDEERAIAEDRTAALEQPGVLVFNPEAGCETSADADVNLEVDGTHAEVTASWLFVCSEPDEIRQLDASVLFETFPGFQDIDAQWVSESAQSAAELSPSSTILRFE